MVHNQPALTRACVESLQATSGPFELCVVDNASDDETVDYLDRLARSVPLRYLRNDENVGLIRALNQGAQLATGDLLCFLHNDTELRDPRVARAPAGRGGVHRAASGWPASTACSGCARDGRYVGRTIVHCLEGAPTLRSPRAEVAVVDGVCLFLAARRAGRGGRLRRGLRLLPRLRPRSLLRGAGAGPALRGRERALRAPGRGHAHRRERAGGARPRTWPSGRRRWRASPRSGGIGCPATCGRGPSACAIGSRGLRKV